MVGFALGKLLAEAVAKGEARRHYPALLICHLDHTTDLFMKRRPNGAFHCSPRSVFSQ
ncbi:hypothetical protein AERO8C_70699 [Aeromonas veronii]|uniref:Uncharacterized protein n=1 Tax=Aeromonas veronii TaxID=654 RepID=A0A653LCD7_AERVE|nr:hypothetical protein AERO8C_70699 [Aeromonas veronii]